MAERSWLDLAALATGLDSFFDQRTKDLRRFGDRVNQVFEAFVFAQTVAWHRERGWTVEFIHPPSRRPLMSVRRQQPAPAELKLKFNTRGRPDGYSFAHCIKNGVARQVRHGLRVMTYHGDKYLEPKANMVLDVSVINDVDLSGFSSDTPLPNSELITFGEAKHMSAFAELVASFLGMVSELQPKRLLKHTHGKERKKDLLPFLYVSGFLAGTGGGLERTIRKRGLAVDIYTRTSHLSQAVQLPTKTAS